MYLLLLLQFGESTSSQIIVDLVLTQTNLGQGCLLMYMIQIPLISINFMALFS